MNSMSQVAFMTLQGLSTAVIDIFYLLTVFVAFMTHYRFGQFDSYKGSRLGRAAGLTAETLVQGLLSGVILSLAAVLLGMAVPYSDYLYLLLPLSFLIGLYHVRYTNMIYAALLLGFIASVLNGQVLFNRTMPDVNIQFWVLAFVVGVVQMTMGLLMFVGGSHHMRPIVAKKDRQIVLGFAGQKFWAVPLVLLAGLAMMANGETIAMPSWWPIYPVRGLDEVAGVLFPLPLLFIMNHGSITFSSTPRKHYRTQSRMNLYSGIILAGVALLAGRVGLLVWLLWPLMFIVATMPELYWFRIESRQRPCFDMAEEGLYIVGVNRRSPAEALGFSPGDRLLSINGEDVHNLAQLRKHFLAVHDEKRFLVSRLDAGNVEIHVKEAEKINEHFGLTFMGEKPGRIYLYDRVANMHMMHLTAIYMRNDDTEQ